MRVVYAKTVIEQAVQACVDAKRDGREIEKIVVSAREAEQLKAELGPLSWGVLQMRSLSECGHGCLPENTRVYGILIESEAAK